MTDMRVPAPMLASPMQAGQSVTDFEGRANWVMEPKLDGVRLTVRVKDGVVVGWSRPRAGAPGALKRELPPHLTALLQQFPNGVYDGELIVDGGKSPDVVMLVNQKKLRFMVFDLLEVLDQTVTDRPYVERRDFLESIFKVFVDPHVTLVPMVPVSKAVVDQWMADGGEGAILKRVDHRYRPGARSDAWVKVKGLRSAVLTVTGFRPGKLGPVSRIDLIDSDGQTTSVAGAGMGHAMLRQIEKNPDAFVGRKLAIEYTERLDGGAYRHPRADHWID